jgi:uncharacterized protein
MSSGWSGTVGELKLLRKNNLIVDTLERGYRYLYGNPSESERGAWKESIPALLDALQDAKFDSLQVLLELQMPVGSERADVILLGGSPNRPSAYIIELKQWTDATFEIESQEVMLPGFGLFQHPSTQVLNYRGKLLLFHSKASEYDIKVAAFLHNMDETRIHSLGSGTVSGITTSAPLFGRSDYQKLASSIANHLLPCALNEGEHILFANAPYKQTRHLFEVIRTHAKDIASKATETLAESGMGLTAEQEMIAEEVLSALRHKQDVAFLVEGGPGSGKTLLAVTLLLRTCDLGFRTVLAIRNNRLQAILKRCFDAAYPGASGMLMFFEVRRQGTGIGDKQFLGKFDLVICDEAQRMREVSMPIALGRAPVYAIFLDGTQRLNPPEQGTLNAFANASARKNKIIKRALTSAVRCRGGQPYHDWIETILTSPTEKDNLRRKGNYWKDRYEFRFCKSPEELIELLAVYRDAVPNRRVAMVASFTESPGSLNSTEAPENIRIGFPLTSGWDRYKESKTTIRWLMKPNEYVGFWMNGKSNNLNTVASIYGAQGFESDFVGIIWGRDLVIRQGLWSLGKPEASYDNIDGLITRGHQWSREALELLKNRYRIFLTRGIEGTVVYCEDAETADYFNELVG